MRWTRRGPPNGSGLTPDPGRHHRPAAGARGVRPRSRAPGARAPARPRRRARRPRAGGRARRLGPHRGLGVGDGARRRPAVGRAQEGRERDPDAVRDLRLCGDVRPGAAAPAGRRRTGGHQNPRAGDAGPRRPGARTPAVGAARRSARRASWRGSSPRRTLRASPSSATTATTVYFAPLMVSCWDRRAER